MNICDLNDKKPDISYPTFWEYKVIFQNEDNAEDMIKDVVVNKEHKLSFSKFSKDKKYKSYSLNVLVADEHQRIQIFSSLKRVAKYVL